MKINHLVVGPIVSISFFALLLINGVEYIPAITAAITCLTAWWWATEAFAIPVTSLIPFVAFPLFGVINHREAAAGLGSHIILLLLGGFLMAKALEKTGAHKRFAMLILRKVGSNSNKKLILAFMLAAAFLSMWISNTATCLMLMPIVLAALAQLNNPKMTMPLILATAYACSIGGIATLIGTPPNVIFAGIYEDVIGQEFGFLRWLKIGLPISVIALPIAWFWLTRNITGRGTVELPKAENWSIDQKRVVSIFGIIIVLWVFRSEPFGGWAGILGLPGVGDSTVAMLGAVLMFMTRSNNGGGLLDWETAVKIPWGIILMYGAGITIAKAFAESGLADLLGVFLGSFIDGVPIYLLLLFICLLITFITELNSNLATTTLVIPILAATALATDMSAELLMIPATISASYAFMLPIATGPNAIAYATEKITVKQMIREGLRLNLILAFVTSAICYLIFT